MKKKNFIITIDTEGDNIWQWKYGDNITTENAKYLSRFQNLCEKYGFKPVYLTNYEMACDKHFVSMAKNALNSKTCEVGMHLHAINNPPILELNNITCPENFPYLLEYSKEAIVEKISFLTEKLKNTFNTDIVSHRAGRWNINDYYLDLLIENGYKIDCSITPGLSWHNTLGMTPKSYGADYSKDKVCVEKYYNNKDEYLYEVPVTILKTNALIKPDTFTLKNILRSTKHCITGHNIWLRPSLHNFECMKYVLKQINNDINQDYIMFMLHSSELMPGGSPNFKTAESIEILYRNIEKIFQIAVLNYKGVTLAEYIDGLEKD